MPENLAEKSIERNAQLLRQSKDNTLSRNYETNDRMLRYRRLESAFFSETVFATKHKSTRGKKCCQVFVNDKGYIVGYPMKPQNEFETALHCFLK